MTKKLSRSFLYRSRSKFRTRRRGSIAPLPAIRLNDKEIMANAEYDVQSMISAAPSITSVSSLASLLKEKMQVRVKSLAVIWCSFDEFVV